MADNTTVTKEELQNEVQAEVKEVIAGSMQVVKKYVDDNSIDNKVKRAELQKEISEAIAKKYDFQNEKVKLEKASSVADTLLGMFDTDGNKEIDPKEFLGKLDTIYSQLDTTNKLSDALKALDGKVLDLKSYADTKIGEVKGKIDTLNTDVSSAKANISALQAKVENEVFTKAEVREALVIEADKIIEEVKSIFYPAKKDNGDGATL